MSNEVTDPDLLAQLNGPKEVSDPKLLAQLDEPQEQPETASRVAGLAARGLATGAAAIPNAAITTAGTNPLVAGAETGAKIGHAIRQKLGWDAPDAAPAASPSDAAPAPSKPTLSDFVHPEKWQNAAEYFADQLGAPRPQNAPERIGYRAAQAAPAGLLAPEARIPSALSSMAGGAAAQGAEEAGAGPIGQGLAGMAGASAIPLAGSLGAATARGITRGGAEGAEATQGRIDQAAQAGTTLTAGQATQSGLLRKIESVVGNLWGGGPIGARSAQQANDLGARVNGIVDNLAGGTAATPTNAGKAIIAGGNTTIGNMRAETDAAYNRLDELVPPDAPIDMSRTLSKLDELAKPIPGAEATSKRFTSPVAADTRDDLTADMASNAAKNAPGPDINITRAPQEDAWNQAIADEKSNSTMPYQAIKGLRSRIGAQIVPKFAATDPAKNGQLKQIYGWMSDDLHDGVAQLGPDASAAADNAKSVFLRNNAREEELDDLINNSGDPENIFKSATTGTKEGASQVNRTMSALDEGQKNLVRATLLSRLGVANPSAQNAEGSVFSPESFLTKWNGIHDDAKDALFGTSGAPGTLRHSLDSIANTTSDLRAGKALVNSSGTTPSAAHAGGMVAAWESFKALLSGAAGPAFSLVGATTANNALARALTNPKTAQWLARTTKLPTAQVPGALFQLSQMQDPDAQNLYQSLNASANPRPARKSGGRVRSKEELVMRLINKWKLAKKITDKSTEPLLKLPDETIVKALDIAGRAL